MRNHELSLDDIILPDVIDKDGPCYKQRNINDGIFKMMATSEYFYRRAKLMNKDYEKATKVMDIAQKRFDSALDKLHKTEERITECTKQVSTNVRVATTRLNDGLQRIEKQANFDRLEQYTILLERAEKAISSLALLERQGRLSKIMQALK